MSLNNPVFRTLLRSIVANVLEDMKKGYRSLFSQFGKNIDKAAEYLWKNKELSMYKPIGYDRLSKKQIEDIYGIIADDMGGDEKTPPSMASMLKYIQEESSAHTTEEDPRMLKRFSKPIYNKLMSRYQHQQFTVDQFYSILNIAAIEQQLEEIVNNPSMFDRVMGQSSYAAPGSPYGKLASDYRHIMSQNLRVLLKYVDSFEN
jgi:hypothetical protein